MGKSFLGQSATAAAEQYKQHKTVHKDIWCKTQNNKAG